MSIDLTDLLLTADQYGNLMPSYLGTRYSEAAIKAGLCEKIIDEETKRPWIRLTVAGQIASRREWLKRWIDDFVESADPKLNPIQCAARFADAVNQAFL